MKISAVSDIHVKVPHDEADRFLCDFLDHPKVRESEYILLLGDIFDLMCGPHPQYLENFRHIFDRIDNLIRAGRKVYFFEGNHDIHLDKLFRLRWRNNEIIPTRTPLVVTLDDKIYYFSHGDEHEIDNTPYQRYIKFITSRPLKFIADHIMPFAVLNFFGNRASKISRKKGYKKFDEELVKNRFRQGVLATTNGQYNFVLGGHSHVKDLYKLEGKDSFYINNGYALKSRTFIHIDNHRLAFEPMG